MFSKSVQSSLKRFFPPIQIHVWGGLGSQLFSLLALEEAQSHYPFRRFRIVFHSSGVTERKPDLLELIPQGVEISIVSDFIENPDSVIYQQTKSLSFSLERLYIKELVKELVKKFRLVASWDDSSSEPVFWTMQVRGHYRMLKVSSESLNRVFDRIKDSKLENDTEISTSINAIHFRIGDLVGLKGIINPKNLNIIAEKIQNENNLEFRILSDSGEIASSYLSKIRTFSSNTTLNTWETIEMGYRSEIFVGTLSKISYWIVILRVLGYPEKYSYLPRSTAEEISSFFKHYGIEARIVPYDFTLIESPEMSDE